MNFEYVCTKIEMHETVLDINRVREYTIRAT